MPKDTPGEYHVSMSGELVEGRIFVHRDEGARQPLLSRLRRVEGQVRGIADMVEQDRYCGDELQQLTAAVAALREVAVLLATQHVEAAARVAITADEPETVLGDIAAVLRAALRIA